MAFLVHPTIHTGIQSCDLPAALRIPAARTCRALRRRAAAMGRMCCAVHRYNALCAECGEAGRAFSTSDGDGPPPWGQLDPGNCIAGASTKRTAITFISMFGSAGLSTNSDRPSNPYHSAGQKLLMAAAGVKQALLTGRTTVNKLHVALSLHALQSSVLRGTSQLHTVDGECEACKVECTELYFALNPAVSKGGRPAKRRAKCKAGEHVSMLSVNCIGVMYMNVSHIRLYPQYKPSSNAITVYTLALKRVHPLRWCRPCAQVPRHRHRRQVHLLIPLRVTQVHLAAQREKKV